MKATYVWDSSYYIIEDEVIPLHDLLGDPKLPNDGLLERGVTEVNGTRCDAVVLAFKDGHYRPTVASDWWWWGYGCGPSPDKYGIRRVNTTAAVF